MEIIREPAKIEEKSMSIIEEYLEGCDFSYGEKQVVKRVIHATGDPAYAGIMVFSPGAVEKAVELLSRGKNLITDVEMVRVGINKPKLEKLGGKADCFIHHPEVIKLAGEEKITRAALSVRWAKEKINGNIMVIGNAPTALFALLDYIKKDCNICQYVYNVITIEKGKIDLPPFSQAMYGPERRQVEKFK
ncbi:MAG: precorrin isomerase [Firmicutes bacterium HGW-Firmicutes-13]|nr:MAG: precorrin isomerase [Firmicutes bacterium HGW-Firmicutes-13]